VTARQIYLFSTHGVIAFRRFTFPRVVGRKPHCSSVESGERVLDEPFPRRHRLFRHHTPSPSMASSSLGDSSVDCSIQSTCKSFKYRVAPEDVGET